MRPVRLQLIVFYEIDASSASRRTKSAVSMADNPTLGLIIVPISGLPATPQSSLVPATPNRGPA